MPMLQLFVQFDGFLRTQGWSRDDAVVDAIGDLVERDVQDHHLYIVSSDLLAGTIRVVGVRSFNED